MPEITVSDEIYSRMLAFKQVVEALLEEQISVDDYVALILGQGIDSIVAEILGPVDQSILVRSFQQLGAQHPAELYSFMAETLRRGAAPERETVRRRLGFHPRGDIDSQPRSVN